MQQKLVFFFFTILIIVVSACALQNSQKKPIESPPSPLTPLPIETVDQISRIRRNADFFDGQVGIYAKNLKTGKIIAVNEHQIFPTASTHKLVVALATYRYLYADASPDQKNQYDLFIKSMMQTSDNPAYFRLIRELDSKKPDSLNQVLKDLQLRNTWIHSEEAFRQFGYHSVTTAYEMATVMETIFQEQYLGIDLSRKIKEDLANTIFQEEIPRFLPNNKIMHKSGSLPGMLCDVGIIDDGTNQILISIFTTSQQPEQQSSIYIADVSADLYKALKNP